MCGIIGYSGPKPIVPILLEGLKRLEYRGYDSAGLAVGGNGGMHLFRAVGKVAELEKKIAGLAIEGTFGIAHTRWATHGKPSEANAHPHTDCGGKLNLVHNGIIENYLELKSELLEKNHRFVSETDTEVVSHLIEDNFQGDLETAVLKTLTRLEGTFGIAVIHQDNPGKIVVAKRGSPIIIGVGDGEMFVASDANALLNHTNRMIYLNDDEMAVLDARGYTIKNFHNQLLQKQIDVLETPDYAVDKKGFPHFMLKEIFEQPESVRNACRGRLIDAEGMVKLGGLEPVMDRLRQIQRLIIVSCGTSYYAGMLGRMIFEELTHLHVSVELASEFRYQRLRLDPTMAVLAISQSGETADTLAAIKEAKRKGALILGIVNVVGSSITQVTDAGVYNHAGPEFGVASTKIYTSQLVVLTLMAMLVGRYHNVSLVEGMQVVHALKRLPEQMEEILQKSAEIEKLAKKYWQYDDFLYIGRLYNYPTALEGALKLKEISYVHAEAYAGGEMKHGPISLIDEKFPTVAIIPEDCTFEKMMGNIMEIKARSGKILAVTQAGGERVGDMVDDLVVVPRTIPILQPILNVIPLQLFAYYIARERKCDIDKPRNLAKSVTVE